MQYAVSRWCAALALALPLPAAWAGTQVGAMNGMDAGADARQAARTAAARALFRPENAIGAGAAHGPAPAAAGGTPALADQRGGADVHNRMRLDSAVAANNAVNVVSGANSIDSGSFANMAGIPVVIQNSGANVLIQNATIINLQFK